MKRIDSIEELKKEAASKNGAMVEFFIALEGTLISSKSIIYYPKENRFDVLSLIDGVYFENLTEKRLGEKTNIVKAINGKAFYKC